MRTVRFREASHSSYWTRREGRTFRARLRLFFAFACLPAACVRTHPMTYESIAIPAPSLTESLLPNPGRVPALVFLPPTYFTSVRTYPVVYYLPGFMTQVTEYVDGTFSGFRLDTTLEQLQRNGTIREMVVVVVHGRNQLGGSFYVNSPVTGRWEDDVVADVVPWIESHYRVSHRASARGIAGESMGGFGALHLAMRHPEVFGAVFALSPGLFDERGLEDSGFLSPPYVEAWLLQARKMRQWPVNEAPRRLIRLAQELYAADGRFAFRRAFAYAYGAAFAPDPAEGPPFVAYPFTRVAGNVVTDPERLEAFRNGFGHLQEKVRQHKAAWRSLRAIGIDIGRQDPLPWIPRGARRLAFLLQAEGISCELTEHDGGHVDRLGERIRDIMLPFFSRTFAADSTEGDSP